MRDLGRIAAWSDNDSTGFASSSPSRPAAPRTTPSGDSISRSTPDASLPASSSGPPAWPSGPQAASWPSTAKLANSFDLATGKRALHLVSAWSADNRLVLGQAACAEKSDAITAIPKLLELLDLSGAIVTIDALGHREPVALESGCHISRGREPGAKGSGSRDDRAVTPRGTVQSATDLLGNPE